MSELKIGLIGLDTSHVIKFAEILNDPKYPHYISEARITAGFPGGSPDVEASHTRVEGFTKQLADEFGVQIMSSPEEVAEACDVIFITSVDGRVHKKQFEAIVKYKKPVFIDKPFTCDLQEAKDIFELAEKHGVPLMSCSVLRYLEPMVEQLKSSEPLYGVDCYTPLSLEPTNPGWFWYGIHGTEMLFRILGKDCVQVSTSIQDKSEIVVGEWADGRIGTIRGSYTGNFQYGVTFHYEKSSVQLNSTQSNKPMTVIMLEKLIEMCRTGKPDIEAEETIAIIRFIEAVNLSRTKKTTIKL